MLWWICTNSINSSCKWHKKYRKFYRKNDNLFIFGAGHIGQALSSKSLDLNFNVHLIDSRKTFY